MAPARQRAPIIGVPMSSKDAEGRVGLPATYAEAVRRAGGVPLLMPPGETRLDVFLDLVDALLLPGGGDIAPAHYGGRDHPTLYGIDPLRDDAELLLARRVVESGMPTLCICRGAQVLNVALGGTLIEHLPDVVGDVVAHRGNPRGHVVHEVDIVAGSRLFDVLRAAPATPSSSHHQAIRDLAPGLRVAARAPDGTIEAVEHEAHPWLLAVQWHPEVNAWRDPVEQRLFDAFVAAAR